MSKKLLFVFNPHSGKSQIKNYLMEILDIFTKHGYDTTVHPTQARLDAYEYIKSHGSQYDRIVISGGDGTLNEGVKGIMALEAQNRCCIGYIPSGTTNDFAATLNIPKNMIKAAEIAVSGKQFKCDIGCFNGKTFNYVAAFGAFTDVPYDTSQEFKKTVGHMAYIWEGMKRLSSLPSYHVKIEYDHGCIDDEIFLCIILNATSIAGIHSTGRLIDVDLNDGMFEMIVFRRPTNLIEFQSVLMGLMRGEASGDGYMLLKSSRFEFFCSENIKWTLDGEYGGDPAHSVIEVLPSAITYIIDDEQKAISK